MPHLAGMLGKPQPDIFAKGFAKTRVGEGLKGFVDVSE